MTRLRRTSADQVGWTRRRSGRGFRYLDADGASVPGRERDRIQQLAIPPAWEEVWICPYPNGHLQAVGTDQAGRRQYLYHPAWREQRDAEKYLRAAELGRRLGRTRTRVGRDLNADGVSLERACATAFRLLDLGCLRVGNDIYADEYGSFGLTTLERRHLRRRGKKMLFDFAGKSGVEHHLEIDDPEAVEALSVMRRRRTDDPSLLAFRDGRRWRALNSTLVNAYIAEVTGLGVSAKDFRTWHASVVAASSLAMSGVQTAAARRRRAIRQAMEDAAALLGNTPTQARTSYVDPRLIDLYEEGSTMDARLAARAAGEAISRPAELAVLRLLG
ncbi:DNA topoisomerase IB [Nocardioides sp. Bht2]|uniref:DNA topoisomerase IB n=1 Tax=Nocardioides sp. Bht2 TaxID=3392297 RepID=UPI0039B570B4